MAGGRGRQCAIGSPQASIRGSAPRAPRVDRDLRGTFSGRLPRDQFVHGGQDVLLGPSGLESAATAHAKHLGSLRNTVALTGNCLAVYGTLAGRRPPLQERLGTSEEGFGRSTTKRYRSKAGVARAGGLDWNPPGPCGNPALGAHVRGEGGAVRFFVRYSRLGFRAGPGSGIADAAPISRAGGMAV